ncbi:MAG: hypothetical protein KGJ58_03615 [Patescibacteria group bacterium]|nr:hypothetical protein [Patescibacteria group bacterium]MDE1988347.1 hypothetical protein [Patescibacteria group bacterium]MDE2218511.1 hypothetical protein [Patescibacteria group bacterium]
MMAILIDRVRGLTEVAQKEILENKKKTEKDEEAEEIRRLIEKGENSIIEAAKRGERDVAIKDISLCWSKYDSYNDEFIQKNLTSVEKIVINHFSSNGFKVYFSKKNFTTYTICPEGNYQIAIGW